MPAFIIQAVTNLEVGNALSFAPPYGALCSENREWREFCRSRVSQKCTITGFEHETEKGASTFEPGDAIGSLRSLLSSPRITVRFEDGLEREVGIEYLLLPQDQEAFKKYGRLYQNRIAKALK